MFDWPQMKGLGPLVEIRVALLLFEVAAGIRFWKEDHLSCQSGWINARIELLVRKQGLDEAAIGQNPAMSNGKKVVAQAIVGGDRLGIERVDVGVRSVLRIESKHRGESMARRGVPI